MFCHKNYIHQKAFNQKSLENIRSNILLILVFTLKLQYTNVIKINESKNNFSKGSSTPSWRKNNFQNLQNVVPSVTKDQGEFRLN